MEFPEEEQRISFHKSLVCHGLCKKYNRINLSLSRWRYVGGEGRRKGCKGGTRKRETTVWHARWSEHPLNFRQTSPHDLLNDVADCIHALDA